MSAELISSFDLYRNRVLITRVRMSAVPADLKPLVKTYLQALSNQLADPENQSWDNLGPNEHQTPCKQFDWRLGPKQSAPLVTAPVALVADTSWLIATFVEVDASSVMEPEVSTRSSHRAARPNNQHTDADHESSPEPLQR